MGGGGSIPAPPAPSRVRSRFPATAARWCEGDTLIAAPMRSQQHRYHRSILHRAGGREVQTLPRAEPDPAPPGWAQHPLGAGQS